MSTSDRTLIVSSSGSMHDPHYTRWECRWSTFVQAMKLDEPKDHKDCGNIVGGALAGDYRSRATVESRSILTLDADHDVGAGFAVAVMELDCAALAYTTWRSTAEAMRWRLMCPLSRDVTPEEYWLIAHAVMGEESWWDKGAAEPERLMHRPSTRGDGSYRRLVLDGAPLDVEHWLSVAAELRLPPRGEQAEVGVAYSGASYDNLSAPQRAMADAHVAAFEERWGAMLAEALLLEEKATDKSGRGWEALARDFAWACACLEGSGWTGVNGAELFAKLLPDEMADATSNGKRLGDKKVDVAKAVKQGACEPPPWDGLDEVVVVDGALRWGSVSQGLIVGTVVPPFKHAMPPPALVDAVATDVLRLRWTIEDKCRVLLTWLGKTYEWHVSHWEVMPPEQLESELRRLLAPAWYLNEKEERVPWNPTPSRIDTLAKQIRRMTIVLAKQGAGHWVDCTDGRCPVGEYPGRYFSFSNGILDRKEVGPLLEHSSAFFNTWAFHFPYDPDATCPVWEEKLAEWFPDRESADHLEEILGHLLLGGMEYDKIFALLGEPRAGKGTVMRLLHGMIGSGYSTQSIDDLTDRFGAEDLLGKSVIHLAEAVSPEAGRKAVSLLKRVSGRDEGLKVKMKGSKSVDADMFCRFVLTGNEELTLPDSSGAIVTRLDGGLVMFGKSFFGKEDETLDARLRAERSGIFNRLLTAHERLTARGRFVQSEAGRTMLARLRGNSAPAKEWMGRNVEVTGDLSDWIEVDWMLERYSDEFKVSKAQARSAVGPLMPMASERVYLHLTVEEKAAGMEQRRPSVYKGVRWVGE